MEISQMKNMVVLKDLPSNIVDEAIIILNSSYKAKKLQKIESKSDNSKFKENVNGNKEQIIKEAEMVISNYISNIEKPRQFSSQSYKSLIKKYKKLRNLTAFFAITTLLAIISTLII